MDESLAQRAAACGIEPGYHDIWGRWREASDQTVHGLLAVLAGDPEAPAADEAMPPAVPPCHWPPALEQGRRVWGFAVQLYALRSARNWGIGDFTDLAALLELAARHGADLVGVNPLHALFAHDARHCSPYAPSSRRFLNVLYVDVEAVPEFAASAPARALVGSAAFQARLRALREATHVDYEGVRAAKFELFERLFAALRDNPARGAEFEAFKRAGGEPLYRHALFEALQEHLYARDPACWGWPNWPPAYRDSAAPAVADFARAHRDRIDFYAYLQWLADEQLAAAAARSRALGMAIGLYADLAVGVDANGADVWAERELYAHGLRIGAPPDDFNPRGQDWGLLPWRPQRLHAAACAPFVDVLRANMRHAGALRIDHVMGLRRLYLIPAGAQATDGAYVRYPFGALLAAAATESRLHRCLVIGEDLGTVPDEVRAALAAARALSYRVVYFERDAEGGFRAADAFPPAAVATVSTHDLPTLAGWWEERDLALREALGLWPDMAFAAAQRAARARDRALLVERLKREGLLAQDYAAPAAFDDALALAVHAHLARTRSAIAVVQPEDVFGERDQANVPGTVDAHPNWRRKIAPALERWADDARLRACAEAFAAARPR